MSFNNGPNVVVTDNMDGTATAGTTGGTMPYSFEWSDGQITETATGLVNGDTYTVTVTDDNGCTSVSSIDITEPDVLALSNYKLSGNMNTSISFNSDEGKFQNFIYKVIKFNTTFILIFPSNITPITPMMTLVQL